MKDLGIIERTKDLKSKQLGIISKVVDCFEEKL